MDNSDENTGGSPLDANYTEEDIAPDTLKQMLADCTAFCETHADLLADIPQLRQEWSADEQNGHDFWLTRNGHGAGFWDRGYGELGRQLTDAAHAYGTFDLYVGDDGMIHGG
jgi:hypothetical protein